MAGRALIIPIYYVILIACIGVSSNFSFRGFYETFPNEIYVVVLILALGLFGAGLLLQIGRDRKSVSQQLLALLIFFIFATFSTTSNMNYIYTKMLWQDVRKEAFRAEYPKYLRTIAEVEKDLIVKNTSDKDGFELIATGYFDIITSKINDLKKIVSNSEVYVDLKGKHTSLEFELEQMLQQATDSDRPGCGVKCQQHVAKIDQLVPTTDLVITKSRDLSEIKRSWSNYRDLKMRAFCSDNSSQYHSLRSLVEYVDPSDFCMSDSRQYAREFPSNKLEKLRSEIERQKTYSEEELLSYLSKVNEISTTLTNISIEISSAVPELASSDIVEKIGLPRSVSEAVSYLTDSDVTISLSDPAEIAKREKLTEDLDSREFFKVVVSAGSSDDDQVHFLDENLSQTDVVRKLEVPLKPFLEELAAKQKEIYDRYVDALGDASREFLRPADRVDPNRGKIGEVQDTVPFAFANFSGTTVISFLLGIAFDIIPIIFAFAAFHGYKPEDPDYDPVIR